MMTQCVISTCDLVSPRVSITRFHHVSTSFDHSNSLIKSCEGSRGLFQPFVNLPLLLICTLVHIFSRDQVEAENLSHAFKFVEPAGTSVEFGFAPYLSQIGAVFINDVSGFLQTSTFPFHLLPFFKNPGSS